MSGKNRSILIIDDEPPLLRMMSLFLARSGYRVTVAAGAAKARTELAAAAGGFDVIVIDATLPDANMAELGTEILSADPNVRLLGASGYPVDMSGLEAVAPGRVAFLQKPFSPDMLAAALRRLLGTQEEIV